MFADLDLDLLVVPILLVCLIAALIGANLVIRKKIMVRETQGESAFEPEENDQIAWKRYKRLAALTNFLFGIAIVAILLDFFLSVRSSIGYSSDLSRLSTYASECQNAVGLDLIFTCAGESLQAYQLTYSWDARYPISGFRLILHLPLILGVAVWTWWQLAPGRMLELKKTSGFWRLLFLGFGGYLLLAVAWFIVGNLGRANLYFLLVLNSIFLFAAAVVGINSTKSARKLK